jgi:hypothetical protein
VETRAAPGDGEVHLWRAGLDVSPPTAVELTRSLLRAINCTANVDWPVDPIKALLDRVRGGALRAGPRRLVPIEHNLSRLPP